MKRFLTRAGAVLVVMVALLTCVAAGPAGATAGWRAPLDPLTVTRTFSPPPTPYAAGHRGVDLAGRPGEAVLAASDGEVSFAAELAGRGVVVVVHGSLRTTYEPVAATVKRGYEVKKGEEIGELAAGHLGCPVSACLHWGLRLGDVYLDPMTMLQPAQIRLLPVTGAPSALTGSARTAATVAFVASGPASAAGSSESSSALVAPSLATWSLAAVAGGLLLARWRR